MDALREWALCVIIAAVAGTVVCVLSPRGTADKAVRTVIGIFVVSTICVPLQNLSTDEISIPVFAESFGSEDDYIETEEYMISVFKSEIENEIMLAAAQYGADIKSIGIDVSLNSECIIIHKIEIFIHEADERKEAGFFEAVQKRLGAPVTLTKE
ncbi:MAG: hypothetical protein IJE48_05100 [Clostridia bacterium]|nr:hypothetical protein [Clostridia bacterium]